jgi:hypothetical protein
VAWVFPATAFTDVGAKGKPAGVTLLDGADATPVPIALVAVTVNVYGVPLVNPITVRGLAEPVAVNPPRDDLTV